ncbi:MAG: hydroxyacid-oxoacid transhydrogenase [Gammaproteobacteria bacterium]
MACCHHYALTENGDELFSVDASSIKFGPGALREVGADASQLGLKRVALYTDPRLADSEHVAIVEQSLRAAKVDVARYDQVRVEPTDQSFIDAAEFAVQANVDGFVSVGGGSVMDTCKAANLYSTYPDEFLAYVNPPIGEGKPVPGPLKPHIACPTTSGTGSECTGIAVFDLLYMKAKTGIAYRELRPTRAVIDPTTTYTLPATVVAASGFDVLSHALESFTAIPYTQRQRPAAPHLRPMSQGANPWSDIGCREALRLTGRYIERAVADAGDHEARDGMMFAATLAGLAFGNAGVHIPHGMSYSVAGLVKDFQPDGYPDDEPICPHGMSVIVNAPAAFRFTGSACPERHLEAAQLLGADVAGCGPEDAGEAVARHLERLMQITGMPNGVGGVGYGEEDVPALVEGAYAQKRLLNNAPVPVDEAVLDQLYRNAMKYWS